jgi:hypothetical protein
MRFSLDYGASFRRQGTVFLGDVPTDAQIGLMRFAGWAEDPDLRDERSQRNTHSPKNNHL